MRRDAAKTALRPDPVREAAGLPVGIEGGYFVGAGEFSGQEGMFGAKVEDMLDLNQPPSDQPGLWCQWVPSEDGTEIVWDGGEKFYDYQNWIVYIVKHFLEPWGYSISGSVAWEGEDPSDFGVLEINNNKIYVK